MDRALGTQMGDGSLQEVWGALVEGLHHGLGVDHEAEDVGVTQRMCWPTRVKGTQDLCGVACARDGMSVTMRVEETQGLCGVTCDIDGMTVTACEVVIDKMTFYCHWIILLKV